MLKPCRQFHVLAVNQKGELIKSFILESKIFLAPYLSLMIVQVLMKKLITKMRIMSKHLG